MAKVIDCQSITFADSGSPAINLTKEELAALEGIEAEARDLANVY